MDNISQRILQAHCQSPTSQRCNQGFVKELAKPTQDKIVFKKFPFPSEKIKNATHNRHKNSWTETAKTHTGQGLTMTEDRKPACNSVYVAIAGEVVNRRSVLLRNFVLNGQVSASNPLLHIHANR
ncbi:MAG: hypothetical protein LC124_07405 [Ignavibacteriales bacterium]|nr:hypothetical protein [Ignavibacteriales bacterium]